MQREIKFRGKRIDNNEWVIGSLVEEEPPLQCFANETGKSEFLIAKSGFADWNMPRPMTAAKVYPESIGQYTGLKENTFEDTRKNKRIFEGDVVEFIDGQRAVVEWNDDTCQFQYSDGSPLNNGDRYSTHKAIVGNLYDNPEILNQ